MELKDFLKFMDSDEGKKIAEKLNQEFAFREELKENNIKRLKNMFNDQKSFNLIVNKIINKHNEKWIDNCYSKGTEPHPNNLLYALFDLAIKEGKLVNKPLDGLTENFPSIIYSYNKWKFAITHGQGSVYSVYYRNKLKYRD